MRAFGYAIGNDELVEAEAEIIREAAGRFALGEPLMAIVRNFNDRGVPTAYQGRWDASTLRNVLKNPRIAGRAPGRARPVPAIVTEEIFTRIQERFAEPERSMRLIKAHRDYLLAGGWLECGKCGKKMVPKGGVPAAYVCSSRSPSYGCGRMRITAGATDLQVTAKVLAHIARTDTRKAIVAAAAAFHGGPERIETLATQIRQALEADADADKVDDLREQLGVAVSEWEPIARWSKWFGDPENLTPASLAAWWDNADLQRRQDLLSHTLDHIRVNPVGQIGRYSADAILDRLEFFWLI